MNETVTERRPRASKRVLNRLFGEYGMAVVLLLLVGWYAVTTIQEQQPVGDDAARAVMASLDQLPAQAHVVVMGRDVPRDRAFVTALTGVLEKEGHQVTAVTGTPPDIRKAIEADSALGHVAVVAVPRSYRHVAEKLAGRTALLGQAEVHVPPSYRRSTFLRPANLINVANQIVVIAVMAIGMTMVIVTGGIDLSVGSLIALSAVLVAWFIGAMGGTSASVGAMLLAAAIAIGVCGLVGWLSGMLVAHLRMPAFIVTLGMMLVAGGLAYIITKGESVYQVPASFVWLGRGADLLSIPNAVILMALLYAGAHVLMARTTLGRYIYAVGGNAEAARLAGVRINGILVFVYTISGLMAGLGGVILASQLRSGAPTYGQTYELYVIAAAVVGGTSLSGGSGKIMGTLIGAFIIGVIQNGMNLTGVESYTQKVVLGLVILGAVMLDLLRRRGATR